MHTVVHFSTQMKMRNGLSFSNVLQVTSIHTFNIVRKYQQILMCGAARCVLCIHMKLNNFRHLFTRNCHILRWINELCCIVLCYVYVCMHECCVYTLCHEVVGFQIGLSWKQLDELQIKHINDNNRKNFLCCVYMYVRIYHIINW